MNNIPYGYDENGVRNGDGRWRRTISQEDIDGRIIGETRYYKDLSDDGDGNFDKGELVLTEEGKEIRELIVDILEDNGVEVV